MRFHLSLVSKEFHWVRSKWFPSVVWNKQCTYLALILTLSPNGPRQDSTWASSPRSSIVCFRNDFQALYKLCTYLELILILSPNRLKRASTSPPSPRSTIGFVQNDFWAYSTKGRKPCTYLAPTLTLSPNRTKRIPHEPRHLGVLSGAVKMISEPCLEQTMHLYCTNTNTISKRTKTRFHLSLLT